MTLFIAAGLAITCSISSPHSTGNTCHHLLELVVVPLQSTLMLLSGGIKSSTQDGTRCQARVLKASSTPLKVSKALREMGQGVALNSGVQFRNALYHRGSTPNLVRRPLEFMQRLAALVPLLRLCVIRLHGAVIVALLMVTPVDVARHRLRHHHAG